MRASSSSLVLGVVACSLGIACGPDITEEDLMTLPSDYAFDNTTLVHAGVTSVRPAWSPANPIPTAAEVEGPAPTSFSSEFNFCFDATPGEFDLNQAAWLSFFAADVYGHIGYFGPQLHAMGFTNPDGGDFDWAVCGLDFETIAADQVANLDLFEAARGFGLLRSYVEERFIGNDRWGACARRWFDAVDDAGAPVFQGNSLPHGSFTSWLLQNPKPENYVEFGCGGTWNFDTTEYEEGSTQAAILRRPRDPVTGAPPIVIVAFRGTQPDRWSDISVDLAFFKNDLETAERTEQGWGPGWGSAHRGFFNAYMSIDEQARVFGRTFLTLDDPPQIYITGHSLGGALATLLASRILQQMEEQVAAGGPVFDFRGVYTFGSPRVGNEQFMTHFNELAARHGVTIGRVRNDDDSVTNVPRFEFEHVGPMFHLLEGVPGSVDLDLMVTRYDDLDTEPSSAIGSPADHSSGGYVGLYDADPSSPTFNTASYTISDTGYYRRLREAYEQSRDAGSPLALWNHCD